MHSARYSTYCKGIVIQLSTMADVLPARLTATHRRKSLVVSYVSVFTLFICVFSPICDVLKDMHIPDTEGNSVYTFPVGGHLNSQQQPDNISKLPKINSYCT